MSFFSPKRSDKPKNIDPVWKTEGYKDLFGASKGGALERLDRAGEGFSGELTAGISPFEQMSMDRLQSFMQSPLASQSDLYQLGQQELTSTLEGKYDPFNTEKLNTFKSMVLRDVDDAITRLRAGTAARDRIGGGGRVAGESRLQESALDKIFMQSAALADQERQRMQAAAGNAINMAHFQAQEPLGRVQAGLQFGGLPRQLEQQELDREYAEWQRQLNDLGLPLQTAQSLLSSYSPTLWTPSYGPSEFERAMSMASQGASLMSGMPNMGGAPAGPNIGATTPSQAQAFSAGQGPVSAPWAAAQSAPPVGFGGQGYGYGSFGAQSPYGF